MKTYDALKYIIRSHIEVILTNIDAVTAFLKVSKYSRSQGQARCTLQVLRNDISEKFSVTRFRNPNEMNTYGDLDVVIHGFKSRAQGCFEYISKSDEIPHYEKTAIGQHFGRIYENLRSALGQCREMRNPRPIDFTHDQLTGHEYDDTAKRAGYKSFIDYLNLTDAWQKPMDEIESDLDDKAGLFRL